MGLTCCLLFIYFRDSFFVLVFRENAYKLQWYHLHGSEQTPGDGEGRGSLVCCSPCGHKELDTTEWLNNNSAPFGYDSCPFKEPRHEQYCWLIYQTHWVKRWEFWLWPGLHHVFWSLFHRIYLSVSTCVGKHPMGIFTQSYLENTDVSSSEWTLHGHSLWRWRIVKGTG